MRKTVKIGKRGKDLAFRIPKALVEKYNIKVGDTIDPEILARELFGSQLRAQSEQI